jgi:hypothetical protein
MDSGRRRHYSPYLPLPVVRCVWHSKVVGSDASVSSPPQPHFE